VVRITVLCLFLHTFQRENTYAKLHENAPFEMKNYINFLGRGHCPPPQTPTPPGREIPPPRTLFPRAFHGQLPRMSSDPRNAPDYNTIIKERVVYSAAALTCVAPVNSLGRTVAGPSDAILTVIFSNLSLAADAFRAGRKSRYAPVQLNSGVERQRLPLIDHEPMILICYAVCLLFIVGVVSRYISVDRVMVRTLYSHNFSLD